MNELHFNTELAKETSLTTALLAEYIRDICELEGKKKVTITGTEFEEAIGIKPLATERALRKVRDEGLFKYSSRISKDEFTFMMRKKTPEADNTLLKFPIKCQFSPKRMLILTILQEHGGWMNSVEVGYSSDGIFTKDAANAALNDMFRKGELLKRDATSKGNGTSGKRIEFKISEVTA
ncbi:hypothetical protein [Bacillus sp. FSL E2-8887]|uniref:hypothetical protein n=1 Tax=Bacillus sp. FSL E2-8887 TaxID=2954599 RepID=UPI0030F8093B